MFCFVPAPSSALVFVPHTWSQFWPGLPSTRLPPLVSIHGANGPTSPLGHCSFHFTQPSFSPASKYPWLDYLPLCFRLYLFICFSVPIFCGFLSLFFKFASKDERPVGFPPPLSPLSLTDSEAPGFFVWSCSFYTRAVLRKSCSKWLIWLLKL